MLTRIDEVVGEPIVGAYYKVWTVYGNWYGQYANWPVIGPKHRDKHCLNFDYEHYHLDARFLRGPEGDQHFWERASASPLMTSKSLNQEGLPEPVLRRRKLLRLRSPFLDSPKLAAAPAKHETWKCHFDEWTGKQAKRDERGLICPHRAVSLAGQPVIDGVVTCPLHFLRFDAATGVILPPLGVEAVTP